MGNIKVSIVIPAYNIEKHIEKCLESVINQTLKEIEIIVVDDGSTDSTLEKINKFANTDSRIKVISQTNQKQGAARNRGIEIARGEYIGFVDSDDYIDTDYYAKLYNTASKFCADIAVTNILKHKKKYDKYNVLYKKVEVASSIDAKYKLCEDKTRRFFYVMNKIFKKDYIKKHNILFPEGCYFEDVMFSTKAIYYANEIVSVPDAEYHYVEHSTSTVKSKANIQKKKEDHINASIELQEFAKKHSIKLPERLNYTESYWQGPLRVYKGTYKVKKMLFGIFPIYLKTYK